MNKPIVRVYVVLVLMLGSLVYFTARWTVLEADALQENAANRRPLIAEQKVRRGDISTRDGVLIARSERSGNGPNAVFTRNYPEGDMYGNPVGYSFVDSGRTGIELSENDLLVGEDNEFASIIDELQGHSPEGANLTLTLDAGAQVLATQLLEQAQANPGTNGAGAVVAIDIKTGGILTMASVPGFDPNLAQDSIDQLNSDPANPLVNRTTQGAYEPGSTMKVVTAAAALDSGEFTPESTLVADSPMEIGGVEMQNSGNQSWGTIDMTTALTNSVNTYFAQLGEEMGAATMQEYMTRFGFNAEPVIAYPASQLVPSGIYRRGRLHTGSGGIDVGRVSIGQERLLATPLQMANVAAIIANGGEMLELKFVQEAVDPDGRTVAEIERSVERRVISAAAAAQVAEMMQNVTREGTAAGLSVGGVAFGGKTGTAEIDVAARINRPWFIGFAPADNPQVAVAAMIERCTGCSGGAVAGPIATAVMQQLLAG